MRDLPSEGLRGVEALLSDASAIHQRMPVDRVDDINEVVRAQLTDQERLLNTLTELRAYLAENPSGNRSHTKHTRQAVREFTTAAARFYLTSRMLVRHLLGVDATQGTLFAPPPEHEPRRLPVVSPGSEIGRPLAEAAREVQRLVGSDVGGVVMLGGGAPRVRVVLDPEPPVGDLTPRDPTEELPLGNVGRDLWLANPFRERERR